MLHGTQAALHLCSLCYVKPAHKGVESRYNFGKLHPCERVTMQDKARAIELQ
jgi:hypothetical protein